MNVIEKWRTKLDKFSIVMPCYHFVASFILSHLISMHENPFASILFDIYLVVFRKSKLGWTKYAGENTVDMYKNIVRYNFKAFPIPYLISLSLLLYLSDTRHFIKPTDTDLITIRKPNLMRLITITVFISWLLCMTMDDSHSIR